MVVVIDNYDSFVYNVAQYLGELGAEVCVFRNDAITAESVGAMQPEAVVLSPGPCTPDEAGVSNDVLRQLAHRVPVLGICLGHQCIGQVFGGRVGLAPREVHGKASQIRHDGRTIFAGLPNPFAATRYHSLVVEDDGLPADLEVSARSPDGLVMGLRHRTLPVEGVQFHPESILTEGGRDLLRNFLELVRRWHATGVWGAHAGPVGVEGRPRRG
ncbi:MAG: aminodeoxychorismate/anthranilate synthase component II [Armatimonadota bacterium]|nr:aminodeoxychorismate/anthranilate synthase component II [Armatimonadota bacterium]MDR5696612.1 aminodeoxychorismate/anthranilate synthase component II [Armatimonadota bacterium]